MKANESDDCGHGCFDNDVYPAGPDPHCLVHGMTPEQRAAWKVRTFHEHYGRGADHIGNLPAFTADMVREAVRRVEDDYHERARKGEL